MQRRSSIVLGVFLIAVWAVLSFVLLAKGGLYIAKHEGDTMHLIDMVLRQADGEWAHLDYMSPIGFLATAPIALFVSFGWGVGMATLAAQVLVGALLVLPIWWVGVSRLSAGWAMLFGAICLILAMALVHGEAMPAISVSMHYNRWAWALAFLAITIAILPATGRESQTADGLVLGLSIAAMALIKITYVAAFLPPILVALLLRHHWRALRVALVAGLAVVLLITVLAGPAFWVAYLGDLLTVVQKADRAHPGAPLTGVVVAPAYLGGSFLAVFSVILLRQAGRAQEGLLMLLFLPGFFYVTFQNFGNDPQWLYLLGVLLLALRPDAGVVSPAGWNMRLALTLAGCAAFMLGLPSALNLAFSPFRHLTLDTEGYSVMLPRKPQHGDIFVAGERNDKPFGALRRPLAGYVPDEEDEEEEAWTTVLNGEVLPDCTLERGTVTFYDRMSRDIEDAGYAGAGLYPADLLSGIWLFGDFRRLHGAAPWRYADAPGIENADYLLVPFCPLDRKSRAGIIAAVEAAGYGLSEVHRGEDYVLLELQAP